MRGDEKRERGEVESTAAVGGGVRGADNGGEWEEGTGEDGTVEEGVQATGGEERA